MSETPRTARSLVLALQNAAFKTGEDNVTEHVSNARLNRNDAACREAEKAVIDRIETLETELQVAIIRAESAEDSLAFQMDYNRRTGEELQAANTEIARLRKENEWHSVSELPEACQEIMVLWKFGTVEIAWYEGEFESVDVTHWRNLPTPPEDKQ